MNIIEHNVSFKIIWELPNRMFHWNITFGNIKHKVPLKGTSNGILCLIKNNLINKNNNSNSFNKSNNIFIQSNLNKLSINKSNLINKKINRIRFC